MLPDRPLTEIEIVAGRLTVTHWNPASRDQVPFTWVLAEAGAGTGEIPSLRGTDFKVPAAPTHVQLVGTRDAAARTVDLTDWGSTQAARVLRKLQRTAVAAGITSDDVAPRSIRHWAGRRAYQATGRLRAAADVLGRDYGIDCLHQIALDPARSTSDPRPAR